MLLLKHRTDPDFEQKLPGILALMRNLLQQETGLQYIEIVLRYVFSALKEPSREKAQKFVNQAFLEQGGEAVMTILEALEKEGYDQGMRQGLSEGLELGLNIKFGDDGLQLMPGIFLIDDVARLGTLKEALKKARKIEDLKPLIET